MHGTAGIEVGRIFVYGLDLYQWEPALGTSGRCEVASAVAGATSVMSRGDQNEEVQIPDQ